MDEESQTSLGMTPWLQQEIKYQDHRPLHRQYRLCAQNPAWLHETLVPPTSTTVKRERG